MPLNIPDLTGDEDANGLHGYINNRVKAVGKAINFTPTWTGVTGATGMFGTWWDLGDVYAFQASVSWPGDPSFSASVTVHPPVTTSTGSWQILDGIAQVATDQPLYKVYGIFGTNSFDVRADHATNGQLVKLASAALTGWGAGGYIRIGGIGRKA